MQNERLLYAQIKQLEDNLRFKNEEIFDLHNMMENAKQNLMDPEILNNWDI